MKQKYYVNIATKPKYDPYYGTYNYYGSSEREFDNYDDAVAEAKKQVSKTREDVVIYKIASVAKFPIDDVSVEEVV